MLLQHGNLTIRNAAAADAGQLAIWWNDGKVMAHAGFPNGLGITAEEIVQQLAQDSDAVHRRLMIEIDGVPAGEMDYQNLDGSTAEIGIKICDDSKQNRGQEKILLSMLIAALFNNMGYAKIVLDTNCSNKRAQHVYTRLGFKEVRVRRDAWQNQRGEPQSFIDYELHPEDFVDFSKED